MRCPSLRAISARRGALRSGLACISRKILPISLAKSLLACSPAWRIMFGPIKPKARASDVVAGVYSSARPRAVARDRLGTDPLWLRRLCAADGDGQCAGTRGPGAALEACG